MAGRIYGGSPVSSPDNQSDKPHKKKTSVIVSVIVGCLLAGSGTFGFFAWQTNRQTEDIIRTWDEVRDIASVSEPVIVSDESAIVTVEAVESSEVGLPMTDIEAYFDDPIDRKIDWDALLTINSDIACWLYIPGTDIDYPVMQEKVLGEYYYLDHDIYGGELKSGSLLIPKEPDDYEDKDMHLLIFGHNMLNGTMFSSLRRYMQADFYTEYPYAYLYYPDRAERWQVWSVYHTKDTDSIYDIPYEANTKAYSDLLADIKAKQYYATNVDMVKPSEHILTLSTCDNFDGTHTGRFVVNAAADACKNYE